MVSNSFLKRFRKLDAYAKTLDDFRVRTATGGTVTLISGLTIFVLVTFEVFRYLTPIMQSEIIVDGGKMEKLPIAFDITFPHVPCYMLSLDVMDESGEHISEYDHDVYKERLDSNGNSIIKEKSEDLRNKAARLAMEHNGEVPENYCGPCYGANVNDEENPCCNTCEEVQRAYTEMGWSADSDNFEQCVREGWKEKKLAQAQEGCRMHGTLSVNKLRGNFHFSAGRALNNGRSHIHDMSSFVTNEYGQNFIHNIHLFQFGSQEYNLQKQKRTKSSTIIHPLEETMWGSSEAAIMYQYFLKIVPTEFDFLNGKHLRTFQYSVSKQEQLVNHGGGLPGVFFMLDHSPMRIIYSETRPTFGSFLTSVCAIIGGIFSVASIIDSALYRAERISKQRKQM
ncbi:endoplasmic reticulum vesicle transporter-domain-containing protein [Gilbertella persicaria]|uniref:endoplasmic reticulum vesicle transporter-domain-containing protein n=1 Tax=Gilbertella persicaria TaxID=101096 RepID=UPI0022208F93|nr:endoplasmic reticulum vesicle transporter-domain-containing protein [Gilbertella persicaria]KAI8092304.1 endoplasmic reticulum vesicle transporter-domain-containing protein [Gilbertella persicaria]